MRKYKILIIVAIFILISAILYAFISRSEHGDIPWMKDLSYDKNQIYDVSIGFFNPCPSIPVMLGSQEMKIGFDTGNGMGFTLTTALEDKVDYETIGTTTELNADGTYRGEGKSISLKSITVFGEEYQNIISSLIDWRMYGFFKLNGTIGLAYFDRKITTLDYQNKKIAISDRPIDYTKLPSEKYTVIPLVQSELMNQQHLLFFEGEVNGEKSTIYLDTGSSRSFYHLEDAGSKIHLKLGKLTYEFNRSQLRQDDIGFRDEFEYPLTLALNSDLLKANHFVITIDKIQNKLIIYKD